MSGDDWSTCDALLCIALARLHECWMEERVGLVAAAISVSDGASFSATSYQYRIGEYIHAEANAIEVAHKYGIHDFSKNVIMAITLSPCIRDSRSRIGVSCVDRLRDLGIRRIHVGVIDQKQGDAERYRKLGFELTVTESQRLSGACHALLGVFDKFGNRVNTDIVGVKKELGPFFLGHYLE